MNQNQLMTQAKTIGSESTRDSAGVEHKPGGWMKCFYFLGKHSSKLAVGGLAYITCMFKILGNMRMIDLSVLLLCAVDFCHLSRLCSDQDTLCIECFVFNKLELFLPIYHYLQHTTLCAFASLIHIIGTVPFGAAPASSVLAGCPADQLADEHGAEGAVRLPGLTRGACSARRWQARRRSAARRLPLAVPPVRQDDELVQPLSPQGLPRGPHDVHHVRPRLHAH